MDEQAATPPKPRSIGERLRAGRERSGLSVAAAAEKLHLDNKVIEALEADRFAELGASVYVRGHLRRYADFVGEPGVEMVASYSAREARPAPPDLTQVPHAERRADPRRLITPLVGLGFALVLALAIWWVLSGAKTGAIVSPAPKTSSDVTTTVPAPAATDAPSPDDAPGMVSDADRSVAGIPSATPTVDVTDARARRDDNASARVTRLKLELANDSWVEVYDSRGERLFYDVAIAGSVHSVEGRPPLRVVLGSSAGVAIEVDGQRRDIPANAADGEGARFVVNRSGSLSRARQ
jgi:cytoskeleton protein RodZ